MNNENISHVEMNVADAIIDRPKGFTAGRRHFLLYPPTLFIVYLTERIVTLLEVDNDNLKINPFAEAIRVVQNHKDEVCLLIAYFTLHTKERCFSKKLVAEYRNYFSANIDDEDLASLLIICLTWDKTNEIAKYYKIDKELERMAEVNSVKDTRNTYTFCGKSPYGTLIASACEKFHWTYDYVVFGISYTNLQMMLKDSLKQIYLSEDEAKKIHLNNPDETLDGNDKEVMMKVISGSKWN